MKLNDLELQNIKGGAISFKTALLVGIGGFLTLLVGIIDGYMNPNKCNIKKYR